MRYVFLKITVKVLMISFFYLPYLVECKLEAVVEGSLITV